MKKALTVVLTLSLVLLMSLSLCACNGGQQDDDQTVYGMLTLMNPGDNIDEEKCICYDEMNSMVLALQSEKIDSIVNIPYVVAEYIAALNDGMQAQYPGTYPGMVLMHMGTLAENTELCEMLDGAIKELKTNGTLAELEKTYIDAFLKSGEEPEPVKMPYFEGADTIKVAVTGNFPPIDYIAADGTPAGFNVAMLSEVSKLLNVNIELVVINSGSRLLALSEGTVDAVFCFNEEKYVDPDKDFLSMCDIPDTVSVTAAYFEGERGKVVRK